MLACLYRSLMFLPRVMFPESHVCPKLNEVSDFKADTILRSFQLCEKHVEHIPLSNITQPKLVGQQHMNHVLFSFVTSETLLII